MLSSIHNKINIAIEVVLYILLAFMPFAFGVVHAWSEEVVMVAVAVLVVLFGIRNLTSSQKTIRFTAALPLVVVFVLVPVFQLVLLPVSVVQTIAPSTSQVKTELLGKLPSLESSPDPVSSGQPDGNKPDSYSTLADIWCDNIKIPLSFYLYATVHDLRLVLSIAAIFFVALGTFRTTTRIKRLLTCITIVGGAVAVLAFLQVITRADKIFWAIPVRQAIAEAGPFANHNNFGQFMNLSIGAAIALLFVRFHELFVGHRLTMSRIANYLPVAAGRWVWYCLGMIILSASSIFLSLTRSGMISLLIATSFIILLLTIRGSLRGRGWIIAVMALGAFICVLYIGFVAVYERLATLQEMDKAEGGRWQIVQDIASAWIRFPVFGTGLGTHSVVYPMFDRSTIPALAVHAENEYAQLLEETGLFGFIPMMLFGITIWIAFYRNIRSSETPVKSAAYGLGYGLLAILIQSLSDFGQHLPANAVLSAIFCALLLAMSQKQDATNPIDRLEVSDDMESRSKNATQRVVFKNEVFLPAIPVVNKGVGIASVLFCLFLLWLILKPEGANDARIAEKQWQQASKTAELLQNDQWQGTSEKFLSLLRFAQSAAQLQPANVEYRHWLNVWRWRAIARTAEAATGQIVLPTPAMNNVRRLVNEFADAIRLCPTYGQSWCMAGQLMYFVLEGEPDEDHQLTDTTSQLPHEVSDSERKLKAYGADLIRTGRLLAPCDGTVCFVAGLLEISEYQKTEDRQVTTGSNHQQGTGQPPTANRSTNFMNSTEDDSVPGYSHFARAVRLDDHLYRDVARIYMDVSRSDLAMKLAADDLGRLSTIADLLAEDQVNSDMVNQVRLQLAGVLEVAATDPAAKPATLASLAIIYAKDNKTEKAVELYRKALAADYGNVYWRLRLAYVLVDSGETEQAMHEARICLRLKPTYAEAKKLIEDLSTKN